MQSIIIIIDNIKDIHSIQTFQKSLRICSCLKQIFLS